VRAPHDPAADPRPRGAPRTPGGADSGTLELVRRALALLGKKKLFLSIHDPSFPGESDEDLGRGSPYTRGGRRFLEFVRNLGFTGIQLGPQGQTSRGNPSPYDGTVFSRNILSIALHPLVSEPGWGGLLTPAELGEELRRGSSRSQERVRYLEAFDAHRRLLWRAFERFEARLGVPPVGSGPPEPEWELPNPGAPAATGEPAGEGNATARGLAEFVRENRAWVEPDGLYEALAEAHGSENWRRWGGSAGAELDRRLFLPAPGEEEPCRRRRLEVEKIRGPTVRFFRFCQYLAHRQHEQLREWAGELGLELFADLQVGLSGRDQWALQGLFLPGYALGAPPSRTNPAGQPWGYPVFDPARVIPAGHGEGAAGPVVELLRRRFERVFRQYDGLRVDHPQGLVCPWVYRTDDPDPLRAVQNGARLFDSPNLPDHPALGRYAVARHDQLAGPPVRRYDDGWVRRLDPDQVERYGVLVGILVESAGRYARGQGSIACEILSTLPYPLERVIARYGLGRFRVTQKADLGNPRDVYRSENAKESDWIMLGTHDSPPIWRVVERWSTDGEVPRRAAYLAERLTSPGSRSALEGELRRDAGRLVHAQMADALASPAEQVVIFFPDLFGMRELYNTPGSVDPSNWTLRVPENYRVSYPERARRLQALNLPYALALALASPARAPAAGNGNLIARLRKAAGVA
jgi:4-alpha-glucanotransferase